MDLPRVTLTLLSLPNGKWGSLLNQNQTYVELSLRGNPPLASEASEFP